MRVLGRKNVHATFAGLDRLDVHEADQFDVPEKEGKSLENINNMT